MVMWKGRQRDRSGKRRGKGRQRGKEEEGGEGRWGSGDYYKGAE